MCLFKESLFMTQEFIDSCGWKLKQWFNLELNDVEEIVNAMGIKGNDFIIQPRDDEHDHFSFLLNNFEKTYEIVVHRGNMLSPYPFWILKDGDKKKYFGVSRVIKVETIE